MTSLMISSTCASSFALGNGPEVTTPVVEDNIDEVGGSDSPSGGVYVKETKVTTFHSLRSIDAAINYTQGLLNKSLTREKCMDFIGIALGELYKNPYAISANVLLTFCSYLNSKDIARLNTSLNTLRNARVRVQQNGSANVNTVVWYRPVNNETVMFTYGLSTMN